MCSRESPSKHVVVSLTEVRAEPLVHWDQPVETNQVPSLLQQLEKPRFPKSIQNKTYCLNQLFKF